MARVVKEKMGEENLRGVQIVVVLSLVIIVLGLGSFGMRLTGKATDTAVVNVTVSSTATINFTDDFIDFGVGQVTSGDNATLESNDTAATNGNWTWTADYFVLENIGNSNVSIELATNKNGTTMLGGTDPAFQYKFIDGESGACTNLTVNDTWLDVNVTSDGTMICNPLLVQDTSDIINISVKLVIPSDSNTGTLTSTFTATGTAV